MLFDESRQLVLRRESDYRFGELPILEQEQRRDSANHEPSRRIRMVVHVHLGDCRPSIELACELLDDGCDAAARTAPFRPEVHQDHPGLDLVVEVSVSQRLQLVGCHVTPLSIPPYPALRPITARPATPALAWRR